MICAAFGAGDNMVNGQVQKFEMHPAPVANAALLAIQKLLVVCAAAERNGPQVSALGNVGAVNDILKSQR